MPTFPCERWSVVEMCPSSSPAGPGPPCGPCSAWSPCPVPSPLWPLGSGPLFVPPTFLSRRPLRAQASCVLSLARGSSSVGPRGGGLRREACVVGAGEGVAGGAAGLFYFYPPVAAGRSFQSRPPVPAPQSAADHRTQPARLGRRPRWVSADQTRAAGRARRRPWAGAAGAGEGVGRKGVFRRVCRWDGPQTPSRRCVPWGDASPALRRLRATSRTLNKSLLEPGQSLVGSGLTPGPQQVPGGRGDPGQREPWGSQGRGGGGACASLGRAWRAVGRRMAAASGRETDSSGQQDAGAWRTGPRPAPHLHLLSLVSGAWTSCLLAVRPTAGQAQARAGCQPLLASRLCLGGRRPWGRLCGCSPDTRGCPQLLSWAPPQGWGWGVPNWGVLQVWGQQL